MLINIAKDFSAYPAGRDENDGPFNGTKFREEFLVPKIREAVENPDGKVVVVLDGVRSFGSSFLEEAFGGLVRVHGFSQRDLDRVIEVEFSSKVYTVYKKLIERYIAEANRPVAA